MDLARTALDTWRRADGPDPRAGVVVALSGGPDSLALLHALLEAGWAPDRILAAHLDHALRPESGADADFAVRAARAAGVACRRERIDVGARRRPGGPGLEAVARTIRYRFLERVARDAGYPAVATGHHRDDQAETVLLRILRGTGPTGLRAIRTARPIRPGSDVLLVRPLLDVSRARILDWLRKRGLSWREDPTNRDGSNLRSLLRAELLPGLESALPGVASRLAELAALAPALSSPGARGDISLTEELLRLPSRLRSAVLLRLPPDGPPMDRRALTRLRHVIKKGRGDADLGAGYRARVRRGSIRILPPAATAVAPFDPIRLEVPGEVALPDGRRLRAERVADLSPHAGPDGEVVDADRAPPPYVVRPARAGDRFRPLGFPAETSVFRFLMGRGVPREERPHVPLLLSREGPVWLLGHRIADGMRVTPGTRSAYRLEITDGRDR